MKNFKEIFQELVSWMSFSPQRKESLFILRDVNLKKNKQAGIKKCVIYMLEIIVAF